MGVEPTADPGPPATAEQPPAAPSGTPPTGPGIRLAALPDLAPGENARDSASGAVWTYVLPDRAPGIIVAIGQPTPASLVTLRQIGRELIVRPTVEAIDPPWPLADGTVGHIAVVEPGLADRLATDRPVGAELERVLAPAGSLFVRLGRSPSTAATTTPTSPTDGSARPPVGAAEDLLWLGLRDGEIRGVVPAADQALIDFVTARWDDDREVRSRLRRVVRRLRGRRSQTFSTALGALHTAGTETVERPPAYIRAAARTAGSPVDHHRWALLDPGSYGTKKILLFLVGPGRARPDLVVKLVRDPGFNGRLEGAWRALTALSAGGPELADLGPRPVFLGHHAGLAFMAESVVDGRPLKTRLSGRPDDPLIGTIADRLVALGLATADPAAADPGAIAAGLDDMVGRYSRIYQPDRSERDALAAAVRRIGASSRPIPLVLQHGDAGTWNVLVGPDDRPILIDWEAAVPLGLPLWDLFYFVRSAAVGSARRAGTRDALAGVRRHLFEMGPIAELLVGSVDRFCTGAGLDRELVEPLFQLCWMHRALKASSTLPPDQLARGHYRRLVKASLDGPADPGLRWLFSGVRPTD